MNNIIMIMSVVVILIIAVMLTIDIKNKKNRRKKREAAKMPPDEFFRNACLSKNHSFGIMSEEEQKTLCFQAKEWWRIFQKMGEKK
jgi:hypothetical protein